MATPGEVGVVGATVRGATHIRADMPNQDAIAWHPASGSGSAVVVAVADGHGSAKSFRSHLGARFAVGIATDLLWERLASDPAAWGSRGDTEALRGLLPELTERWAAEVRTHLKREPFEPGQLGQVEDRAGPNALLELDRNPLLAYGATLVAVVVTPDAVHYLQLGDGDILTVWANGEVRRPLPPDRQLIANETTSLCQPEAWRQFRLASTPLREAPRLILACTDGYGNSFASETEFLQVGSDILPMVDEGGIEAIKGSLKGWLQETTEHGAGDDVTLAVVSLPFATALPPKVSPAAVPAPAVPRQVTEVLPPAPSARPAGPPAQPGPTVEPVGGAPLVVRMNDREYDVTGYRQVRIGRDPAADIRTRNYFVSNRHAVLRAEHAGWVLEDVGSRGGLYCGGRRVQRLAVDGPTSVWLGRPGEGDLLELFPDGRRPTGTGTRSALLGAVGALALLALLFIGLLVIGGNQPPAATQPPGGTPAATTGGEPSQGAALPKCEGSEPRPGVVVEAEGGQRFLLGRRILGPVETPEEARRAAGKTGPTSIVFGLAEGQRQVVFYAFEATPGEGQPSKACKISAVQLDVVAEGQPSQPTSRQARPGGTNG